MVHKYYFGCKNIYFVKEHIKKLTFLKILKTVEDIVKYTQHPLNIHQSNTVFIGWKSPQDGWIKLNCDGAYKDSLGLAGCGGLFRNSEGRWIKGYARKIGTCDALSAEMWGMYLRMQLAWRYGFHQLHVESDSKTLVDMITGKVKINGNPPTLVRRIQELLKLNWQVLFNHTWREGNRSADWLANFSFSLDSFNTYVMETPHREVSSLLFDDISGACMPRNIRVSL
jgi:ribonuclease HI